MERTELARASFGRLALRMGIVDPAELRRAITISAASGGSLEASLLGIGALSVELADHVRAALGVVLGHTSDH